jgi:hypothetical protein
LISLSDIWPTAIAVASRRQKSIAYREIKLLNKWAGFNPADGLRGGLATAFTKASARAHERRLCE